ncbi:Mor transcription activator family protein [Buttiauxella noackiae]|uniref:Mor transcription activator family protein n=1 Tax=Buttiauxella noackiae TaxID=82992 RepID=UPI0028D5B298|nr:Mor transcription activator family protein [Buttiauxella noackiae]
MELEQVKSLLPETVLSIAELIGFPATANLLKVLGGTTFPVGKGVRALGAARMRILKEAIGDENTAILVEHFGGTMLYLPRCDRALRELRNRSFMIEFELLREQDISSLRIMTQLCPKYGFSDRFAWELLSSKRSSNSSTQDCLF